jgi:hypothetical protein
VSKKPQPCPYCQGNESAVRIVFSHFPEEIMRGTLTRRLWREGSRGDRVFMVVVLAVLAGFIALQAGWFLR